MSTNGRGLDVKNSPRRSYAVGAERHGNEVTRTPLPEGHWVDGGRQRRGPSEVQWCDNGTELGMQEIK